MTPHQLDQLRALAGSDPVSAALVELLVLYRTRIDQLGGLRVGDVRPDALVVPRADRPGRIAARMIPRVARLLSPLCEGRSPDEPLFPVHPMALRGHIDALLERAGITGWAAPEGTEGLLHISETEHGVLSVVDDSEGRWLLTDALPQGVSFRSGEPPSHVLLWTHLDPHMGADPSILLLGGGAFVGARWLEERYAPARLDVVERDARCMSAARMFFDYVSAATTEVHHDDALAFVSRGWQADALIYDLADARGSLPHLADPEIAAACAAVAPVLLANLILPLGSPELARTRRALADAGLTQQQVVPLRSRVDVERLQNVELIACRGQAEGASGPVAR